MIIANILYQIKKLLPFLILVLLSLFFFHNYIVFGKIPFPGDLLVSEYQPFRSYSYQGYAPGAVPNKAQYFDSIREFYPWRTLTTQELKNGKLPVWNPYNFSGTPHLANYQSAVFYPLNLLYLLINQIDAWAILVLLQPLLASFFMYLYIRKLNLSFEAGLFGGIVFGYCSYMNVWSQFQVVGHTIAWLPLILFGVEQVLEKISAATVLLLVTGILFSLFAGHPLDFIVIYSFAFLYLLFNLFVKDMPLKKRAVNIAVFILPVLLGAAQLIPTARLLSNSSRSAFSYDFLVNSILIPPGQLIMLLVPDFFGNPATRNYWPMNSYVGVTLSIGISSLLCALFSLWIVKDKKKDPMVLFFAGTAFLVLAMTTKNPLSLLLYRLSIPVISTIQPTKLLSLSAFSLSVLSAKGLDMYLNKKISKKMMFYTVAAVFITLLLGLLETRFVPATARHTALKALFLGFFIAGATSILFFAGIKKSLTNYAVLGLFLLLIAEQYYAFQKFNPFSPRDFIFPQTPIIQFLKEHAGINRFWGYGTAKIDSNIATEYKLFSSDGFDALNLKWYNEFVRSSKDGHIPGSFNQDTRSVAEIAPGYGETDLQENKYRLRILDMLGTKYILNRTENPRNNKTFPTDRFKLVWEDSAGWQVFENTKSAPRFFLTNTIELFESNQEFEKLFFSDSFNPADTILLYKHDLPEIPNLCNEEGMKKATIGLVTYEPSELVFALATECPVYFFISDTFEQGWKATIDNKQADILRANYSFRAIYIPGGSKELKLHYSLF